MMCMSQFLMYMVLAICKNRNGESGNGMRGMMGTQGIRMGTWESRVEMRGMGVGMLEM